MNKKILMCGSDLSVKGGITSVIRNFLEYEDWNEYEITYIPTHVEKNILIKLLYFCVAYVRILKRIKKENFQIVYFHTAERGSFYRKAFLLRVLKKKGLKVVLHHHAAEFEAFYNSSNKRKKSYICKTLEMADLNIVLSERLISMITSKAPRAKVKVLFNAVKTYETNMYNQEGKNILFMGRLGKRKGVYDLIKVIEHMDSSLDDSIKFFLCGDGEIDKVKIEIDKCKISHRISKLGWIDSKQKEEILKTTMINILPSYNEGLPMTILETMAYGIPNISTNIASIPEVIVDGINGYIIQPGDLSELESRIEELVKDSHKRNCFSEQAWQLINNKFSLNAQIRQLEEYLSGL